ncbi:hypothetical protein TNCV_2876451 [Trichonephila clavipes]|nr:hypothetical protein TNCV_2876451 [Trichonephila clavipes]
MAEERISSTHISRSKKRMKIRNGFLDLFVSPNGYRVVRRQEEKRIGRDRTKIEVKTATPAESEPDVALYVGVFGAVAVFVVVVIAMVMLVRRIKGRDPCMYRGAGTGRQQFCIPTLSDENVILENNN